MSDVSQGPGWWLASDGKWYSPESRVLAPPPPPPAPASAQGSGGPMARPAPVRTEGLMDRWRQLSTRVQLVIMLAVTAVIVGVLYVGMNAEGREPGSASAASACSKVIRAGGETFNGSRSMPSFLSVVQSEEVTARTAATLNEKYRPVLESIVALRTALVSGGDVSGASGALVSACG